MNIEVRLADYTDPHDGKNLVDLLDAYARDQMGGSTPLLDGVKEKLIAKLSKFPAAFSVICYVDKVPAGMANCFEGFSTFNCKPLINVHDIAVVEEYRGLGLSQLILAKVEEVAQERGCCKITLEVLEGNQVARNCYKRFGFSGYELDPLMGQALFWQKKL